MLNLFLFSLVGCGDKAPETISETDERPDSEDVECNQDSDCGEGRICVQNECVDGDNNG